jgi:hypothetical protein
MEKRRLNRWQASGLHLLISIAIAVSVLALMLSLWYPGQLFEAMGGNDLLLIIVAVDVVVGPLITLVIFKSGKRGLKFDLAVIAALQLGALAYGVHAVYLARPAFIVFVGDQFQVVSAAQLDPEELAKARFPEFRQPPVAGPLLAYADIPTDPAQRRQFTVLAMLGHDLQQFPRFFVPYGERTAQVVARSYPLAHLRAQDPQATKLVEAWLAESRTREADVRYVYLRARRAWMTVLLDAKTAQPVKMLITEQMR